MSLISINKTYGRPFKPGRFRRLAIGSWNTPADPTIYGVLEVNVEKALKYVEEHGKSSGERITITHFVGKVFAEVLTKHPQLNCQLRFGKFYPRKNIDLSFQVAIEGDDLSAGFVGSADQKSIAEIARELNSDARKIRREEDPIFGGTKKLSSIIPGIFLRTSIRVLEFFINTLNIWTPLFGLPKNAFGSILITNVGSLGIDFALPALYPPANVASIIAVGAIYRAPIYETDEQGNVLSTRLERFVRLCGAFDHRYVDGVHASRASRDIRRLFDDPSLLNRT